MKKLIYGNWKMGLSADASVKLAESIKTVVPGPELEIAVFPSFCAISAVSDILKGSSIIVGGQDCFWETRGAFTGEVSPLQLKELGCTHVLIGHSERRRYLGETDEMVNHKMKVACDAGLSPILCIGETGEDRRNGLWAEVIARQTTLGLRDVEIPGEKGIVIAYEPIWAVGTGRACDPTAAREAHALVMNAVIEIFGAAQAKKYFRIIYGGSVDGHNIASYLAEEGIDGALVGGASQKSDSFLEVIDEAKK
jgi:triosephosphate isomerase